MSCNSRAEPSSAFKRFNSAPAAIRLVVMIYVGFPLSLRDVEDLLAERGIDICHETVRFFKKTLKRHGSAVEVVTDCLRSFPAAMNDLGFE